MLTVVWSCGKWTVASLWQHTCPGQSVRKYHTCHWERFDTKDGIFDVAWSEVHENQIVSACGDGSIKLWDATLDDHPIRNWQEHAREVFSIDWNNVQKDLFASGSWDGSVKIVCRDPSTDLSNLAVDPRTPNVCSNDSCSQRLCV